MSIQKPKGTEDFYPEDMSRRSFVFGSLRATAQKFGYQEISTPAFETLELLSKKEGEEIKSQIFTLEKRSKEEFGLRFDLTVPITRAFIDQQKSLAKPVKWFGLDRMWRYEQPQKGRLREFYQLSVELFGTKTTYADAEIITLALECLKSFGLTSKDIVLKLNNRRLLQALLLEIISEEQLEEVIRLIDKSSKVSKEDILKEFESLSISEGNKILELVGTPLDKITSQNKEVNEALEEVKKVLEVLGDNKDFVQFDLSTARGLAYYTGIVFEVFDRKGEFRAILGGGRYDNLVEMFGGQSTPATGFGLGYTTLSLLLEKKKLFPSKVSPVDYYIATLSEKEMPYALSVATKLRENYSVETDLVVRNLGNQLKYANKLGVKKVIIIGDEEAQSNTLTVKNLETGKEEKVTLDQIQG